MDGNIDNLLNEIDGVLGKQKTPKVERRRQPRSNSLDVPNIINDELINLGYNDNARLALISNLGRENSWNADTIFSGHSDPANNQYNRGLISWQKDRRTNLENYVRQNGGDFTPSENNLRLQTRFLDKELQGKFGKLGQQIKNPNLSLDEAYPLLQKYILYRPEHEGDNKKWEAKARERGIGRNAFSGATDYSGLIGDIDAVLGPNAPQPETNYENLLNDINVAIGESQSPPVGTGAGFDTDLATGNLVPKGTAGNYPVFDNPPAPNIDRPMPESSFTIESQLTSAADGNSPRSAVLLTEENQNSLVSPENQKLFTPIQTANGKLLVNIQKAKTNFGLTTPQAIQDFVNQNGFARLIGKVEDVGDETGDGLVTVRTTDKDGRELSSSIVNQPENIQKQKDVDAAQFPNQEINQEVTTVEDALQKRASETNPLLDWANKYAPRRAKTEREKALERIAGRNYRRVDQPPVEQTETLGGMPETDAAFPEAEPGIPQTFSDNPIILDEDYRTWIDYKNKFEKANLTDSPETRAQFQKEISTNENFGSDVNAAAQVNTTTAETQNVEAQNVAAQEKYQRGLAEYNAKYGKPTSKAQVNDKNQQNAVNAPQSYAPAGSKEESVSTFDVDLSQKPSGVSASDYANKIALQRTGQFSDDEIDSYLRETPQTTKYDGLSDSELKKLGSIPVTVRQGTIDEIIARRPEFQRQKETERQLLDSAMRDDELYAEAKKQLTDERDDHNLWTTGGLGSYIGDKVGQFVGGEKPEPTQEEVMQRFEQLKQSRLNDEDYQKASNVGDNLNYYLGENLGGAAGGIAGSGGRVFKSLAGLTRPLSSLGIEAPFREFSKIANYNERIEESSGGDGIVSKTFKVAGALPGDISQLAVLTRLPGGTVVGFAAHSGLQLAGSGAGFADIKKQTLKGAATGALFPVASVIGKSVAASPAIQTAVKIGTISVGTTTVELASGTPLDQAIKAGIQNGLFELLPIAKEKILNKVGRFWSKGKPTDVAIDEQGNVSLVRFKDQANPNRVDFEMVLDPTDGVYKSADDVIVNRGNKFEPKDNPRELLGENPKRIETAQPEALQKVAVDTRAQKIVENIKDGKTYTVEQLQKATKYNKSNVEETLMNLYSAKQIEILPNNSIRFIGGENAANVSKSLFERAGEVTAPKENINLPKSSEESKLYSSDSTTSNNLQEVTSDLRERASEKPVNTVSSDAQTTRDLLEQTANRTNQIYEALPQQKAQAEKIEKPKAKLDYAEPENIAEKLNVFTERGRKASIAPKVVEQSDLLTSLDEGYPPEFQPRDRSRAASKAQISEIAGRLNPEFLGDSPKASDGRPLVVPVQMPDGATKYAVISGNGRTAGIREAYNLDNDGAKSYKEFASSKGGKDFQQPVYVGVMSPNEIDDFSEFAKEANESATAQMSASEMAKSDADRLDSSVLNLFVPSDDGAIHGAANRDFVRSFLDKTTSTSERNRYIDAEGKLNQEGVTKVKNAIFAKAFGGSEMGMASIQRMSESTDSNIKNITNALLAKAGELSSLAEAAKDNRRFKNADIAPDFARAMEKYSELKDAGTPLDEYVRQGALFGADTSPLQTRVMQVFDHYKRRSKSIRGIIDNYIKAAEALGDPNQRGLFGDTETPSKESIFEAAVKYYAEQDAGEEETEQNSLFNPVQRREDESAARRENSDDAEKSGLQESGPETEKAERSKLNQPLYSLPATFTSKAGTAFYSQLEKTLTDKMPRSASAAQVKGIISNPQTGIKKEEIDWLGIDDFLNSKEKVSKDEILNFIQENQVNLKEVSKSGDDTSFSQYQLDGERSNYRELLLTLPEKAMSDAEWFEYRDLQMTRDQTPEQERREEELRSLSQGKQNYRSSHFEEPNILAHVRFNERKDSTGAKTLFVEEIQSDMHQAGRKQGYRQNLNEKERVRFEELSKNQLDFSREFSAEETSELYTLQNKTKGGVPDAPFKKSWHELAFKRMIRYAAENDFDKIAWTTGEQQNARYDLSKSIDSVNWRKIVADGYKIEIIKDGRDFVPALNLPEVMNGEKLAEVLGKDVARTITESDRRTGKLEGENLKMNGGGMTGFYDKIVPSFVNKYVKKWNAKVEDGEILTNQFGSLTIEETGDNEDYPFSVVEPDGTVLQSGFESKKVAEEFLRELKQHDEEKPEKVHSVTITPEMKASVLHNGQPLFQRHTSERSAAVENSLRKSLSDLIEKSDTPEELLKKAKIEKGQDGVIYTNPEATELIRRAHKIAFEDESLGVFYGSYLNPYHRELVADGLWKTIGGMQDYDDRQRANAVLRDFNTATDEKFGDLVQISTGGNAVRGLPEAVQEEKAHRADYRVGLSHSIGKSVVQSSPAGLRAIGRLRSGAYEKSSVDTAAMEVAAKLFVDGETETGLSSTSRAKLQVAYLRDLLKTTTAKEIRENYAPVSKAGEKFSDYAERKERKLRRNSGNNEQVKPNRATEFYSDGGGGREVRRQDSRKRVVDFAERPRNHGTGFLDGIGSADQQTALEFADRALEKAVSDEIAYARATPTNPTAIAKAIDLGKAVALDAISIPKSLKASVDISAAGRQGLILTVAHPKLAAKAFVEQFPSMFSGQKFEDFKQSLENHPFAPLADASGLYLSTRENKSGNLNQRDEQFMSRLLADDTLFTNSPKLEAARKIILSPVMGSERAYVTYLDSIRMGTFVAQARTINEFNLRKGNTVAAMGKDAHNEFVGDQMKGLASFINNATGRGGLGKLEDAAPYFNAGFFSIRYLTSRLQLMNPFYYAKLPPGVRGIALGNMLAYVGSFAGALLLLKMAGGDVGFDDPNDPNMFKVSFGDFHYDFGAGFVQPIRFLSRLIQTSIDSKKRGTKELDLTKKFIRSKLAPTPGSLINLYTGKNFIGEKVSFGSELQSLVTPMIAEDLPKAIEAEGGTGALKLIPSVFGIGTSIYAPKGKKVNQSKKEGVIRPFADFSNVRQSENVEDQRDANIVETRAEKERTNARLERWNQQRRSQNVIDKRAGTPINGYVEALISGDKANIKAWKKEIYPEELYPVELEYIREMEKKYLGPEKKKYIPPTVKR